MLALIRDDDAPTRGYRFHPDGSPSDVAVRRLMELAPLVLSRIMA